MSTENIDEFGLNTGAAAGAAAWFGGAIITFILAQLNLSQALSLVVGFLGPVAGTLSAYMGFQTWFITSPGGQVGGYALFTILPILALILAGFFAANKDGSGAKAAVGVTVGYFAAAVLSVLILLVMGGGAVDILNLVLMLIVAGVVFPLIFGGLGGLVADQA